MRCADVVPLLPWLLNGTLAGAEADELRAHLRDCAGCRRELRAAAEAWELFDAHPPAAEVVAHALGATPTSPEVAAHLERCPSCRLEIALVREEAREEARDEARAETGQRAPTVAVFPPRAARAGGRRQLLALAAAVLAVLAGAGWLLTWQRLETAEAGTAARRAALERRIAELEVAVRAATGAAAEPTPSPAPLAGERLATLERELAGLRQPQGIVVIELLSEETVLRGGESRRPAVDRERPATLLLVADGVAAGSRYRVRIGPPGGAGTGPALWEGTTRAAEAGVLALHLPAASLPRGEHLLRVSTLDGGPVASYRVAVR